MTPKVLLVDDDSAFRITLSRILELQGLIVLQASNGKAGLDAALAKAPDLVILDIVMPGLKGIDVCRALKEAEATAGIPVLMLTGNDQEGLDIVCLDMGADDYLTKPVRSERLLAHCRALLRRTHPGPSGEKGDVSLGPLKLEYSQKLVVLAGREYRHLTPKEFDLLYELVARSPEPRQRAELYRSVWGAEPPSEGSLRTVEVHVRRIRLKLGASGENWLKTIPGRGYCALKPRATP